MTERYFEETQRFGVWIYGVLIGLAGLIGFIGGSVGAASATTAPIVLLILATVFFAAARQETVADREGVRIKTLYFVRRFISYTDIVTAEAVTYRPLGDFGGWGYRLSANGKAYNMRGDRGVQLTLVDGGRVLIGSQRPDALAAALYKGMNR